MKRSAAWFKTYFVLFAQRKGYFSYTKLSKQGCNGEKERERERNFRGTQSSLYLTQK